jgi:hypothetical protein
MKKFTNVAAQGDVMLRRIDALPDGVKLEKSENGKFILAHSETGHSHIVLERPNVKFYAGADDFVAYLSVEDNPVTLDHLRDHDTHETLEISPGHYEVRRQREYVPQGFRKAAD